MPFRSCEAAPRDTGHGLDLSTDQDAWQRPPDAKRGTPLMSHQPSSISAQRYRFRQRHSSGREVSRIDDTFVVLRGREGSKLECLIRHTTRALNLVAAFPPHTPSSFPLSYAKPLQSEDNAATPRGYQLAKPRNDSVQSMSWRTSPARRET